MNRNIRMTSGKQTTEEFKNYFLTL